MSGVTKNMDSVFANCTEDELDFDVLFPDDDSILDFVAGVDESGEFLTGPNYDYSKILAEADMLEDADDAKEREGKVDHNEAPEGSKDVDPEIGGEVGDGKEVSGKEKSAESEAHDMEKLSSETAKQTAMQKAMEISAQKFADKKEDPACCKENAEYEGYEELIEAVVTGFMSADEIMSEDASKIAIATADYLIKECEDAEARDGKVDQDNKGNVEGVKTEVIDKQTKGAANEDPIADDCDQAARDGEVKPDTQNVEGIANRIIGAAMEAASGDIDKEMDAQNPDTAIEKMDKDIVPDSVRDNTDANKIDDDIKNTQECAQVEDAYKQLIGGMKVGLQKLALAKAMDESVISIADIVAESAEEDGVPFSECAGYENIVEAVIGAMNEDQLAMENSATFALEVADFICEMNARQAKKAGKTAVEMALKDSKRAGEAAISGGAKAAEKVADAAKKLENAGKTASNLGKEDLVDKINAGKEALGAAVEKSKNVPQKEIKDLSALKKAANWAKDHKKGLAIGAAAAAGVGAAALAAKKIAVKKKAEKQEDVKENCEYPEYNLLVEAIIGDFTDEEVMAENASEMACTIADILIEKADKEVEAVVADDDDADIEAIANDDEPDVNLQYNYSDDELIDMVADDKALEQ